MANYIVTAPPATGNLFDIVRWVVIELEQISDAINTAQILTVSYKSPNVLLEGEIRYFGEGGFDPGHGPGPYCLVQKNGSLQWTPMFPIT